MESHGGSVVEELEKPEEKKKKKRRHKHHHQHRKTITINFDLPGVVHVVMTDAVEKYLNCIVGEGVTAEKPWKKVSRDKILENIEMEYEDIPPDYLPFYTHKTAIIEFPDDEILIGYIPDESREYDEFYFCTTKVAEENILMIVKEMEEEQQIRLKNAVHKVVREWKSLGSEAEVEEDMPTSSRGYYKVELETSYPIMDHRIAFHFRLVQHAKDGFVELKVPARYAVPYLTRRRIDNYVQAAAFKKSVEVQTNYPFPKNTWTQYKYECTYQEITKYNKPMFISFFDEIMDPLSDRLFMNYHVNLFDEDYKNLMSLEYAQQQLKTSAMEKMSFKDIIRCKDKMISALEWHPMWTGTVAVAYANLSSLWVNTVRPSTTAGTVGDHLWEAVHGQNPVLIWSFQDSLKARLLLETNCEVHCLSFCPHNPDLLVGGCVSGQIVLWDIKNKLNKVEEVEILTAAQHKYRALMFSMMKWMTNVKDLSIVPITVISSLTYSHLSNVTSVKWLHPQQELTKTGHLKTCDDYSYQFTTTSSDGVTKFWDLKQKAIILPGEYKPQRKSKRFKTRPPALTTDVSPYRSLNRKMLPHYQLNVVLPKADKTSPLTSFDMSKPHINYEPVDLDPDVEIEFTDRIIYKPVLEEKNNEDLQSEFVVGTYLGEFVVGSWEGYEYSLGDLVSSEQPKILSLGRYHDGPVLTIAPHPNIKGVFLTVGGKVFAIWSLMFHNAPVFWRRSKQKYTHGDWRHRNACSFSLSRADGNREIWNLRFKSNIFYYETAYSGKAIFEGKPHPRKLTDATILGLADFQGTLRIISVVEEKINNDESIKVLKRIIKSTTQRRVEFVAWQKKWIEKHASWIIEQREQARLEAIRLREEEEAARKYEEELKASEAAEAAKKVVKSRPPPGHFEEWAHEQYICREQERMGNVLLTKKRMDRETLVKQEAPLKKHEAELERKRHKQRSRLLKADQIFNETIKTMFPDLLLDGKPRTQVVVSEDESSTLRSKYFDAYGEMKVELDEEIEENPYIFKFNWKDIVFNAKQKKKTQDFGHQASHRVRQEIDARSRNPSKTMDRKSVGFSRSSETFHYGDDDDDEDNDTL